MTSSLPIGPDPRPLGPQGSGSPAGKTAAPGGFVRMSLAGEAAGCTLHVLPTDRFKSTLVRLVLHAPLTLREAPLSALLPSVLRRGCKPYPTLRALSDRLDELFGAELEVDVLKIGERQLLTCGIDLVADRFLPGAPHLFRDGLELLRSILFETLGDSTTGFPSELVEQEKANLAHAVEAMADDPTHYAVERTFQSMCAGEPFSVYEFGTPATVRAVSSLELRRHHEHLLATAPADIFVVGAVEPEAVGAELQRVLPLPRTEVSPLPATSFLEAPRDPRRVTEVLAGTDEGHGELVLGYRTTISMTDALGPALILVDELLGGGPTSRLFRQLREEEQLMYSVSSFLVKSKGLWLVLASIENDVRTRVEEAVERELSRLAHSQVEEGELEMARQQVLSQVRSVSDSPRREVSFLLGRIINGSHATPRDAEAELRAVTSAELAAAASTLKLDTSYFLRRGVS